MPLSYPNVGVCLFCIILKTLQREHVNQDKDYSHMNMCHTEAVECVSYEYVCEKTVEHISAGAHVVIPLLYGGNFVLFCFRAYTTKS